MIKIEKNTDIEKLYGMSIEEILKSLELEKFNGKSKNSLSIISKSILNKLKTNLDNDEILVKSIKLNIANRLKESISFPPFKFNQLSSETWENSSFYKLFAHKKIMFFVYKEEFSKVYFVKTQIYEISRTDLEEIKRIWFDTKNKLKEGNIVREELNGKLKTSFIGSSESYLAHIRPHARNSNDTDELPCADSRTGIKKLVKQSIWINNKFIEKIIRGSLW